VLAPQRGGGSFRLDGDPARAADSLKAVSAKDAAQWPEFAARVGRLAGFLEALYSAPAPSIDASSATDVFSALSLGMRLRKLGKAQMVDLMRIVPMSVAEVLDDVFESDALKGVVGARGITNIFQGPRAGGTAFVMLHHQVGRAVGAFHAPVTARGGVGELARALADSARAAGVDILTDREVKQVTMHGGRAIGVVLTNGVDIGAPRVISSVDPRQTFMTLCDPSQLSPEFTSAVGNIKYKGAWAKVNLALDGVAKFPGATGDETIVIAPSLDYLERAYDDAKYGKVSERPYLQVRVPSNADSSMAPAGKSVVSVHVQYAPHKLRDASWDVATRNALGDRVMAMLEEYAPGISKMVVKRQVLTPGDLEAEYSLPEGNLYHGELTLDQILFMRPVAGSSRYATPVPGLFMCGSGTHPGGGIAGGCGVLAAREILKYKNT
jgi:phytoene dehydrogenase-like protein